MGVIRQLKNFFTGNIIYPKTLTKAVYDENGERLDKILRDTMLAVDSEEYNGVDPRDADTLGGKYTAKDISAIEDKLADLSSSLLEDILMNNEILISTLTPTKTSDTVPNLSTLKETYKKIRVEIWYEQKSVLASTTALLTDDLTGVVDCMFYDDESSTHSIRVRYAGTTFNFIKIGSAQTNYCGAKMYGIKY